MSSQVIEEEVEVLSSIFQGDLERLEDVWGQPRILLRVQPHLSSSGAGLADTGGEVTNDLRNRRLAKKESVLAELEVTFAKNYPKNAPAIKVLRLSGVADAHRAVLNEKIRQICKERSGTDDAGPFIFDVVQVVHDCLMEWRVESKSFYDQFQAKRAASSAIEREKEETEREQERRRAATVEARVSQALLKRGQSIELEEAPVFPPALHLSPTDELDEEVSVQEPLEAPLETGLKSRFHSDFEELEMLGFGGFGKVLKSRNRIDGHLYAIKQIRVAGNVDKKTLREVSSLAKMNHAYIVRYFQAWVEEDFPGSLSVDSCSEEEQELDRKNNPSSSSSSSSESLGRIDRSNFSFSGLEFGDWEFEEAAKDEFQSKGEPEGPLPRKILFIQMEYCPGQTLREVIDTNVLRNHPQLVWKLFRQLCEALQYIHNVCHFIHRDLKPANVFIAESGDAKLGDFGLAVTSKASHSKAIPCPSASSFQESNTAGAGTALYSAAEVATGKYNEKVDMWSLGIVLFEMLVPAFATGMERIATITELREHGEVASASLPKVARDLIKALLSKNPKDRPSAVQLLESGKLPQKLEMEEAYFAEVMRVIKTSKRSPLFARLIQTLFKQHPQPVNFFTYDADVVLDDTEEDYITEGRLTQLHETLFARMVEVFRLHGAVPFSSPFLTPKTKEDAKNGGDVELMDAQGTIVQLPKNLTRPFARYLALREHVLYMKRFDISRVFINSFGGQPRSMLQACLDFVLPLSDLQAGAEIAWHADFMRANLHALQKASEGMELTIYIQDWSLLHRMVRKFLKNSDEAKEDFLNLLDSLFGTSLSWHAIRLRLEEDGKMNQEQVASLKPIFVAKDPLSLFGTVEETRLLRSLIQDKSLCCEFRPWLPNVQEMESGLFFAIVMGKRKTVAITGGRYDKLVKEFWLRTRQGPPQACLGSRIHLEKIGTSLMEEFKDEAVISVLVASPVDGERVALDECCGICNVLRGQNIRAEWVHPWMQSEVTSDTILGFCKAKQIRFLLYRKAGKLRVIDGLKKEDREFSKIDQVIKFIKR